MNSDPQPISDARSHTGLLHWAATTGVDCDNALALVGSILSGVAGPSAFFEYPWGMVELHPVHLIIPASEGLLPHTTNLLLSPARRLNRQILATMAGVNPSALDFIQYASLAGDPANIKPHNDIESVALRDLRMGLAFDPDTGRICNSESDLLPDGFQCRVEAITRPAILLESPSVEIIPRLLSGCHLSHALGVDIPLRPFTLSAQKNKEISLLGRWMGGSEVLIPPSKYPTGIEHNRSARLHALLRADLDDLRQLLPDIRPLLEQSLLLVNTPATAKPDPSAAYFGELFGRTVSRIIILRRNGMPLTAQFFSLDASMQFQEELSRFSAACDTSPTAVGTGIRSMPQSLAWALIMLRENMKQYDPPGDEEVIAAVFDASHRLLQRHGQQVIELSRAVEREEILRRARIIVRKIQEKELVSFSNLVRSFDQQRTNLYRPIVDVLVEAEVLNRQADGKLRLGTRQFDEAATHLFLAHLAEQ